MDEFHQAGGGGLFHRYNSMSKLLATVYPEYHFLYLLILHAGYNWDSGNFRHHTLQSSPVVMGFWNNMDNQRHKMEQLRAKLSI